MRRLSRRNFSVLKSSPMYVEDVVRWAPRSSKSQREEGLRGLENG